MTNYVDKNRKMSILNVEVPKDFKGEVQIRNIKRQDTVDVLLRWQAKDESEKIITGIQSGKNYCFNNALPLGSVNEAGTINSIPLTLTEQIDLVAEEMTGKKIKASQYLELPKKMQDRLSAEFNEELKRAHNEMQLGLSLAQFPLGIAIKNYLFDGGIGVYKNEKDTIYIALYRNGIERFMCQGNGIFENITGEPFGYSNPVHGVLEHITSWGIPSIYYLIDKDSKKDVLNIFNEILDSVEYSNEFKTYINQIKDMNMQNVYLKARNDIAQNQAAWNQVFAQQQQAWAASDRLRDTLSRNLDSFRAGLNQSMNDFDSRINTNLNSNTESSDDYIQRLHHESIMGVNTYEREDGSTVEFSTRADRVFENNLDNTTHFGTEHYYDNFVPDGWNELNRKK